MPIFSRPMTIQRRFWLYTVMMLLLSFGVFSFAVFQLPNQVLNNVDNRLLILAQSMVEEAAREDDVEWSQQFDWPTTLLGYQTASSFFVVINTKDNGKVIKHSANISDGVAPLDLSMARSDKPQFTTRQLANGDSIRVFSYPIVLVYGTEQEQKEQAKQAASVPMQRCGEQERILSAQSRQEEKREAITRKLELIRQSLAPKKVDNSAGIANLRAAIAA